MALKKCENCGIFFGAEENEALCKNCSEPARKKAVITGDTEHDKFANARAVVYDQPNITPEELVKAVKARGVGITITEVMKYVTDGRLTLITVDGGNYCSSCGRQISIGTICNDCTDKLDRFRKPAKIQSKVEEKKRAGMHTKNK